MADNKIYLPAQRTRRGKAGYLGKNILEIGSKDDRRESPEKAVTGVRSKADVATGKKAAKAEDEA